MSEKGKRGRTLKNRRKGNPEKVRSLLVPGDSNLRNESNEDRGKKNLEIDEEK